jgi:hypothetical protein
MFIYDKLNIIGAFIANIMHVDGSLSVVIINLATLIVYMRAVQMKLVRMFSPTNKVQETMDSDRMETLRLLWGTGSISSKVSSLRQRNACLSVHGDYCDGLYYFSQDNRKRFSFEQHPQTEICEGK